MDSSCRGSTVAAEVDAVELCGAYWSGDDMLPTCDLPKDHDGDHHTEVTWPQWLARLHDTDREPSALERTLHTAWAPMLEHQLRVQPVVGKNVVLAAGD